jgi:hypothetical protein
MTKLQPNQLHRLKLPVQAALQQVLLQVLQIHLLVLK